MGLLDLLWDDTLAGPRPESGLGKLRKHNTFSFRSDSGKEMDAAASFRSFGNDSSEEATKVTRKIMIIKPPGYITGSPPVSPAGSVTPTSPFAEGPFSSEESQRWSRMRKQSKLEQKAPILIISAAGVRLPALSGDLLLNVLQHYVFGDILFLTSLVD